ncbi:MAG: TetR/AcrR family transcriptional regulator [Candidatus Muirbacterium halophilum]|nr:TetR/AcrR family transcriptional regulator [Candidatus Muirbacterium halophilum]MCK9477360.1 TetR/AcrR family transcriptional regulator [Candidatus Muirbacterium halophilum]
MAKKSIILNNALKLFTVFGYDNTGVQKIADISGITKPTLYHYFGSKDGLLYELIKINVEDFLKELYKSCEYNFDVRTTLEKVVFCFFKFAKEKPDFCKFFLNSEFSPNESDVRICSFFFRKNMFEYVKSIFEKAENDHGNMKGRSQRYTISFLGTINSYISMNYSELIELDDHCVKEVVRQYLYGIFS